MGTLLGGDGKEFGGGGGGCEENERKRSTFKMLESGKDSCIHGTSNRFLYFLGSALPSVNDVNSAFHGCIIIEWYPVFVSFRWVKLLTDP